MTAWMGEGAHLSSLSTYLYVVDEYALTFCIAWWPLTNAGVAVKAVAMEYPKSVSKSCDLLRAFFQAMYDILER